MSSKFFDFKASERPGGVSVDTNIRIGGNADLDVGTSGSYRPFDADLETPEVTSQQNTSESQPSGRGLASANASADQGQGTSVGVVGIAGGSFQETGDRSSTGKREKHQRDGSSDSSSSSSSSDEDDKESAKAKRKKKKKRKGILSGSFLPKFGASKKRNKADNTNRKQDEIALGVEVTPPPGNIKARPPSAEVQIQADFDSPQDNTRSWESQDDTSRPDIEIFGGIGADERLNTGQSREEETLLQSSKDDIGQGSQRPALGSHDPLEVDVACGAALLPEAPTPPFIRVTVTSSSVDKCPPPELRPVDDGTDVDLGFAAHLDGEYYDPSIETMDTTDLLSQIENTINSIEAAQQAGASASELEINVDPTLSISANANPHSVDIPAVDDLNTSTHIALPEPKDGPIPELPEDAQGPTGIKLPEADVDTSVPDVSLQISPEGKSHSPSSSTRSSSSEKGVKSKNIFPSLKFHMPKVGGKKSPGKDRDPGNVSFDAAAEKDFDGVGPSQPDLVLGASDVSMAVETSHKSVDDALPDLEQKDELSLNTSLTQGSGRDAHLGGDVDMNADFDPGNASLNIKDEHDRDDSSDIEAYLGGAAVVPLPSVHVENNETNVSLKADAKAITKEKQKKGKLKMPKFRKFGSKKVDGNTDVHKAVTDIDVQKPEADNDIDMEISGNNKAHRPTFDVVGKRASLKRDQQEPNIEIPVSQEVQLVVESKPHGDFEVSLPAFDGGDYDGVDPRTAGGTQQNGVNDNLDMMDGNLDLRFNGNISGRVEVDGQDVDHLKDGLTVRDGVDMDDTSDIEAYLDPPKVAAGPVPSGLNVKVSPEKPDTSAKVIVPYNKGKVYRKGNRNTPKFKSKPNYGVKAGAVSANIQRPKVTISSDVGVDKSGPSGDFQMNVQSPGAEESLQTPKADVKASVSEPNLVYDGEVKRKGFTLPRLKMPKFKKKSRRSSKDKRASGSFDAEMGGVLSGSTRIGSSSSMPDISYGAKGQAELSGHVNPEFDGPSSPNSPQEDTDERKKKRWSGGFKFPSFGLPKFGGRKKSHSSSEGHDIEVDVSVNKPQVGGIDHSIDDSMDVDGNLHVFPEVDFDSNVGADVDQPSDKAGIGVNIDTDLPNIERNIEFAEVEGQSLSPPDHDVDMDLSLNRAVSSSAKTPSIQMHGMDGVHDFDAKEVDLPGVGIKVDIPKGKKDKSDHDVDVSLDGNINVPSADLGFGSDIADLKGDVEAPDGETGLGVEGNIDIPRISMKVKGDGDDKSVTSTSSSSSSESDEKQRKKRFFGSLHLPKFGGKGRAKKPKGSGVDKQVENDTAFKPTGTTDVNVDDEDVVAGVDIVAPEVSVSQKEIKPDVDVDISKPDVELPDVSGNIDRRIDRPSGGVEVDIPTGEIDIDSGDQEVNISGNVDGDIDVARGDFDIGGDIKVPRGDVEIPSGEIGIDVGVGGNIDVPEVGIKIKGDGDDKSVTSSSSSEGGEKKKKGFFGSLHFPKFGGKGRTKKSIGTGVSFDHGDDVDVDVDGPQVNVQMDQGDADMGGEVVMPGVSVMAKEVKPDIDVDISKPNVELPDVSGGVVAGGDLPSCEFEVDIPKGNVDVDRDDHDLDISAGIQGNIDVSHRDFGIRGDIDAPGRDVDTPSGEVGLDVGCAGNIDMPEVGIKMKGDGDDKSVTSTSSSSSSESDEKKKKKGFFGSLHLPKFGGKGHAKKPKGLGVDIEGDTDLLYKPKGTIDVYVDNGNVVTGAEIVAPDVSVSQKEVKPDVDVDISKPDVELPDVSGNIDGRIGLPSGGVEVDIPTGKIDIDSGDQEINITGNVYGDVDVPRRDFGIGGDIKTPRGDVEIPSNHNGKDVGVGGNIDMPEVRIKIKGDGDDKSVTSSSSSEGGEKKKKGFFGSLHLPKFGGKGGTKKSVVAGVSFDRGDDVDVDLDRPQVNVQMDQGDVDMGGEVVMPEVSVMAKEVKPDIDVDISKPDVELPDVSGGVVAGGDLPSSEFEVDIPRGKVDVDSGDHDLDVSAGIQGNIDVSDTDFGIRGDIDAPGSDVDTPSGEVGLNVGVGGSIDMPEVGIKMKGDGDDKSVTSTSSSSSSESDEKKKKKGFFGSLHLPKFRGKGRRKKPKGPGVDMEGENGTPLTPTGTTDVNVDNGDVVAEVDIVAPEVSVSQKEIKPDVDVDISKPDVELPDVSGNIDGRIDLPSGGVEVDIPTGETDIDSGDQEVNISGNVDGDIDVARGDFDIGGDIKVPRGDVEIPSGEIGIDVGVGGNIDVPEVGIKIKGDGDDKSVTSSSSSEGGEKKKKGFFGSLHFPKFGGKGRTKKSIGTGVSFDRGDDVDIDLDRSQVNAEMDQADAGIGGEVVMPEMTMTAKEVKPNVHVDVSDPDVELPDVSSSVDGRINLPSDGVEVDIPTGKIDIDSGDQEINISGNVDGDIDVPRGDFGIKGDFNRPRGDIEIPSGEIGIDVGVGGNIHMPEVEIKTKGDGDDKSVTSSSSSEGGEKKKKGFFGSLHLPKFGGKGRTKKSIGTGVSFDRGDDVDVDLDRPQVNVQMDQGDVDMGGEVVMPEVSVMAKELKPDIDVDISKPDVELPDVSGGVVAGGDLPSSEFEVDIPKGKVDVDSGDHDLDVSAGIQGNIDVLDRDFGIRGDIDAPGRDVDTPSGEVGLKVGVGGNIDMPEVGIKMKGDGDDKSVTSTSSSSSSESDEKKKKKGFFGSLHLPKFGGKGRAKRPKGQRVDVEDGYDIAVNPTGIVDLDMDGDFVAGVDIVAPEVSASQKEIKPEVDVDITKPDVELPDVSGNVDGRIDLPSGGVEVDIPTGEIDIDSGDQEVNISGDVDGENDVPSGDFGIGGDIKAPKGDVDIPGSRVGFDVKGGGYIDMPEVGINMEGVRDDKSVTSTSSSDSSESDDKKKTKGFLGSLHLPKFSGKGRSKKPKGSGVDIEAGDDIAFRVDKPTGTIDIDNADVVVGASIVTPDVSATQKEVMPNVDVDISKPDVQLPDVSSNVDGRVDLPSGGIEVDIPTGKDIDTSDQDVEISGSGDGDIHGPNGDFGIGGGIHTLRSDVEAPHGVIGVGVGVGGNVDIPEVGIKMEEDGDNKSVTSSSSSSSSEGGEKKKKKGFFGSLHLPKFGGKGRTKKSIGTRMSFDHGDHVEVDVDRPQVNVEMDQGDADIGGEVVMPGVSVMAKEVKPDIDVDILKPGVELPDVSGGVVAGGDLPRSEFKVDIPTGRVDIDAGDQDVELSGSVDGNINLPSGDTGIEGDIDAPRGDFEAPHGEIGIDVGGGGNIDIPEVGIKMRGDGDDKSVTSSSSASSSESDEKKKKKGFFGSLHLPKFGGKGHSKKPKGPGVDIGAVDDIALKLDKPAGRIDVDAEIVAGAEIVAPEVSVSQKEIKPDIDVDTSKPDVELLDVSGNIDGRIDLPSGGVEVDIPTGEIDIDSGDQEINISGNVDGDIDVPRGDFGIGGDINAPRDDVEAPSGEMDKAFDLPRFGVGSKGDGDDKSVTSSSSSEEEKKEKKGLFGGLHLPKLGFPKRTKRKSRSLDQSDVIDVNLDEYVDVSADPNEFVINPEVSVEVQADKGDLDAHQPEVGGTFESPDMQVAAGVPSGKTISDLNVDHDAPDVDITIRGASGLNGLEVEGDINVPQEPDVDVGRPEVTVEGLLKSPSIDLPNTDVDVEKVESGSAAPGNLDVDVQLPEGVRSPDVSLEVSGNSNIRASSTSSSSSSSSEDEEEKETTKKKKKGFLPFHLPKIHLKRPKSPEKKKGLSPANVEVELKTDVDVPDTDIAGALVTGVDISDGSVDLDQANIEFSGPEREIDLGPEVEEPEVGVSVASLDKPKLNLSFLGEVDEPELDINGGVDADIGTDVDVGIDGDAKAGMDQNVSAPEFDVGIPGPNSANVSDDDINFEKFGQMLGEASFGDTEVDDSLEVNIGQDQEDNIEVESEVPVFQANKDLNADFDLRKQLGVELAADDGGDTGLTPSEFNAGIGLSRSSSKSSVSSSSSSEKEVKAKKSKGFLPSLKFPKLTSGKSPGKGEGDGKGDVSVVVEENIAPSLTVDVESAPPVAPSKVETKSPRGKLGLFKKGKAKKGDRPESIRSDAEVQAATIPSVNVSLESTPPEIKAELDIPSASSPLGKLDLSGAITAHSMPSTPLPTTPSTPHSFSVVVAIDFGTTFSGYAYSFTKEPDDVHVMRKWEGGDPGVINMKTLTTLLLTPEGEFHSFGFSARDFYHDMNFTESQKWLYFDKYKLALHDDQNLNIETELVASNGTRVKALTVFTHTLKFFKDHFLEELMDLSMDDGPIDEGEIRWVLTVPAIWRQPAKQFMRRAAYQAGIASPLMPNQLLIALEPEAASIYIGKLSMKQLMPERMALKRERWLRGSMGKGSDPNMKVIDELKQGSRYVVVDCGGGTVNITVHEWEQDSGTLKELHKASGGTFGSINVDEAFIKLMVDIFGRDFIEEFKVKRPAGWVDLLLAFEARKRNANPWKAHYLNVSLPFSFIDYYKKFTNGNLTVDKALMEYNSSDISWCGEAPGMLRFSQDGMFKLFQPTIERLMTKIDEVLEKPELGGISHVFLAGGFAESPYVQHHIREKYKDTLRVVIPQDVGLATLKGAVMYGQNPKAVSVRRTRLTYGVGALNSFNAQIHPEDKKIVKDGKEWCKDVFDVFVYANQSVTGRDKVTRSYAPASTQQDAIKINIFCTEREDCLFITDEHVHKCGTLTIDLQGSYKGPKRRELQLTMQFGDTEVKVDALDVATGKKVEARVDFLNN